MTIVNAAGRAMTDVTDGSQLCDVTDDQKLPSTRSYLTVGLPDPHPGWGSQDDAGDPRLLIQERQ